MTSTQTTHNFYRCIACPVRARNMLHTILVASVLMTVMLCSIRPLSGQNISIYSSVVGVVKDTSGAVVPGVTVTATNVNTGISNSAT
jgi:hypothetical protein